LRGIRYNRDLRHARRNLFEQLQPFPTDAEFERGKAGGVSPRSRQTSDEAGTDRIGKITIGLGSSALMRCGRAVPFTIFKCVGSGLRPAMVCSRDC
jgi:hypothetical protein